MAKFDISRGNCESNIRWADVAEVANNEPAPIQTCLQSDSIRMHANNVAMGTPSLGHRLPGLWWLISACVFGICTKIAHAAPPTHVDPDPPSRKNDVAPVLPPSWDLDGLYVWLGPSGAASRIDGDWDSTIGGDLSVLRVRERELVGTVGASLGASRWTVRGGGRIWLDGILGTRVLGRMAGISAGPILELSELSHPRYGGSFGVWTFVGVTPYARVGTVTDLGGFVEVGIHIALPIVHRH